MQAHDQDRIRLLQVYNDTNFKEVNEADSCLSTAHLYSYAPAVGALIAMLLYFASLWKE